MAVRRLLSWLLTGASVLLVPKIVYWIYYWYFYVASSFANAFPRLATVFSFLNDMLEEAAGAGLCGLLISLVVYGVGFLTIRGSEKLCLSVLGGHFLVFGLLSLYLLARNGVSFWRILQETGFKFSVGLQSVEGFLLLYTMIAQMVYTFVILQAFSAMGSLKLLFGNRKRVVFMAMPRDAHDNFSAFAYVPDMGGLLDGNGKINHTVVDSCLNRARQAGAFKGHSDCMLCDSVLMRKDAVRLIDSIQVHEEGGDIFFNPDTPLCQLLRIGTKGGRPLFCALDNARQL